MWTDWFVEFPSLGVTPVMVGLICLLVVYSVGPLLNRDLAHLPGPRHVPIIGMVQLFFTKEFWTQDLENMKNYGKVYRVYEGRKPSMIVADIEILKQILIKNFEDFTDRKSLPISGYLDLMLLFSRGTRWRRLRYLMTPPFTTGRIKKMWGSLQICVERLHRKVGSYVGRKEGFNVLELGYSYSMDALCTSLLAVDTDTMNNTEHPILTSSIQIVQDIQPTKTMVVLYSISPIILKILSVFGIDTVNTKHSTVIQEYLEKLISSRKQSAEKHEDMLQMLIDANTLTLDDESIEDLKGLTYLNESERLKGLTKNELLAQVLNLVLAGYDTTGRAMAYFLYCMAKNRDIQEKLYQEIQDVVDNYEHMTYEMISKMAYLDQCLEESLRLYTIAPRMDRVARRDVHVNGVFIPRDTLVTVPYYAIQHDPDIWPEPFQYDPERFSVEAKASRDPFYNNIPFGKGPRRCIAERFVVLEMKMAFVRLLLSYKFSVDEAARNKDVIALNIAKHGLWIRVNRR